MRQRRESKFQVFLHIVILPVTDDDLAVKAQAAADKAKFAVAVRGLIQVHEIHVNR